MSEREIRLRLGDRVVAEYVLCPELAPILVPRPYLHPVRTLAGVVVTDAQPADHRWHLGASLAVPDVSGTNLWGGRSYVRDAGYTWRYDHGRIVHAGFLSRADDHVAQQLRWCDPAGATLLDEHRWLTARPVPGRTDAWTLEVAYTLTAPPDRTVTLGSPATNGRPGGAGYGGFFWRAAPCDRPPRVFTASGSGEAAANGSAGRWVALARAAPHPYTLLFTGLSDGDRWFVRSTVYPGVCAALAFAEPRVIDAGASLRGRHRVLIADAVLSPRSAGRLAASMDR